MEAKPEIKKAWLIVLAAAAARPCAEPDEQGGTRLARFALWGAALERWPLPPDSLTFVQRLIGPNPPSWKNRLESLYSGRVKGGRLGLQAVMKELGLAERRGRKEQISVLFLDEADRWAGRLGASVPPALARRSVLSSSKDS